MELAQIIELATAGIELANNAIKAANAGDLSTAQDLLTQSRDHYAKASAAWEAAA